MPEEALTRRERQILHLLAEDLTNREIADRLTLAVNTVKWYARQLYAKLEVDNRRDAVGQARALGLLPAMAAAAPPMENLPAPVIPVIGREVELSILARLLWREGRRLVTVAGPGGMGKSTLAVEFARRHLGDAVDCAFLIPAISLSTADEFVAAITQAVGVEISQRKKVWDQLLHHLRDKATLLVLDDVTSREVARTLIVDMLHASEDVRVLATSRQVLGLSQETVVHLQGLPTPTEDEPADIQRKNPAVQLFVECSRRVRHDFELHRDDVGAAARICNLVEGMPLAILLAAAWTNLLSPAAIAAEIQQDFDFLQADSLDLPERQHSVRVVFRYAWNRLNENEQQALMCCSVFRGGFSWEAAREVIGTALLVLKSLVGKSLIVSDPDRDRYAMHELLRQYSAAKLAAHPELEKSARDRHGAYYCSWLGELAAALKGTGQQRALASLDADDGNALIAWRWAVANVELPQLREAAECLGLYYDWKGRYAEGEQIFQLATEALMAQHDGSAECMWALVETLTWQAHFVHEQGRAEEASQLFQQCLDSVDDPDLASVLMRTMKAQILWQMAPLAHPYGRDRNTAEHLYRQSLDVYQAAKDPRSAADAMIALGQMAYTSGRYGEARRLLETSLADLSDLDDRRGNAHALASLSMVARAQARHGESVKLGRQALALWRELGERTGILQGLINLAPALWWAGKFNEAQAVAEKAERLSQELGSGFGEACACMARATIALHTGRNEAAHAYAERARPLFGEHFLRNWPNVVLGKVAMTRGSEHVALQFLARALASYEVGGFRMMLIAVLALHGFAHCRLGRFQEAREHLARALQLTAETPTWTVIYAVPATALLLREHGESNLGGEAYNMAQNYPFVARSVWFSDMALKELSALEGTSSRETSSRNDEIVQPQALWDLTKRLLDQLGKLAI